MGHYATASIQVGIGVVRRCSNRWALPEPRLTSDGYAFEMNASEVRAWVNYLTDNYDNPKQIDCATFLACTVMENIARDYINHAADVAPTTRPERLAYLRKATKEFRLLFV